MKKTITINLNDYVKVKLTDVGKDIYYRQNEELNEAIKQRGGRPIENRMPAVDEDGYTSFQLHDLMTLYGPHIAMWKQLPFETNILYDVVENAPAVDAVQVQPAESGSQKKPRAIFLGIVNHLGEVRYRCPVCESPFASSLIFYNEKNDNGTKDYCPWCKTELDGLECQE